jgi:hypothetical protein
MRLRVHSVSHVAGGPPGFAGKHDEHWLVKLRDHESPIDWDGGFIFGNMGDGMLHVYFLKDPGFTVNAEVDLSFRWAVKS